jgi:hypothetical protein
MPADGIDAVRFIGDLGNLALGQLNSKLSLLPLSDKLDGKRATRPVLWQVTHTGRPLLVERTPPSGAFVFVSWLGSG